MKKKSDAKKATVTGEAKASHLKALAAPLERLDGVPFEPEVLRMLEIQAALMGPDKHAASLVNALVIAGAQLYTEQGLWWRPMSPKVVRFQSA